MPVPAKTTTGAPAPRSKWKKRLKIAGVSLFSLGVFGFAGAYMIWVKALEDAKKKLPLLEEYRRQLSAEPTRILSADGVVLYQISAEKRDPVRIDEVPDIVKKATLAAEDKRFYHHQGVDAWAVARQVFTNVKEKRVAGGASTLTMQLAKRLFTKSEQTMSRKLQDAAIAVEIERNYTKDQILELYLNQVYYGAQSYGIAQAAQTYFGKSLKKLSIAEAATLARCVRRPSSDTPFLDPDKALDNRNDVLRIMRDEGWITQAKYENSRKEKLVLNKNKEVKGTSEKVAPYFVDYVLAEVQDHLPNVDLTQGGYTIETTLDTKLQKKSEEEVRELVQEWRRSKVKTAAFLLIDKQGRILSMVGGVDYERNQFNMVVNGRRQVGSTFKPFVYAVGLERGVIDQNSMISNEAIKWYDESIGGYWEPHNTTESYVGGSVSLRTAVSNSINLPAVHTLHDIGRSQFVSTAQGMFGFQTKLPPNYSLALGAIELSPMELARAYTVFFNDGYITPPYGISTIRGQDGAVIKDFRPEKRASGLSQNTLQIMNSLLRSVVTSGTATAASGIPNARAKTGTTNDNRDAWFMGYTDELLGVGWISNEQKDDKNQWIYPVMNPSVFGGKVTVNMWREIMAPAQRAVGETETTHNWAELSDRTEGRRRRERDEDRGTVLDAAEGDTPAAPTEAPITANGDEPKPEDRPRDRRRRREDAPDEDAPIAPPVSDSIPGVPDPKPEDRPKPRRDRRQTVTVWICPDSGALAKSSCNEQVPRTFVKGQEPKRYCGVH